MDKGIPFLAKGRDQLGPIVAPAAGTTAGSGSASAVVPQPR
jgi:hypothetical protein